MKILNSILLLTLLLCFSSFVNKMQPITIFMIGDSTMANRETDDDNQERGWGQMLPLFFSDDIKVENHAACGRSTKSFIDEGRWQTVLDRLQPGDYVIIQFGHNDEKNDTALHTVPGGSFDENLRRFVRETKEKGGYPILMNSIVRRNYPPSPDVPVQYTYEQEGTVLADTHGEYACSPQKVARELQVAFVDMTGLTRKLVEDLGAEKSKELFMWIPAGKYVHHPQGKTDNTHLNIHGSKVVAGIAADALVKAIPQLAAYYLPDGREQVQVIHNGVPWFDEQGNIVNAHGACIVEDGGRYWLFGEYKSDESNAFPGFGCYSSADLVNWRFERIVLPVQKDGILGPNRVGERVKVMRCPKTGEYVMLMHADDLGYNDPYIGIATSQTINGDYTLHGPILFEGKPLKHWDMGTFQDTDGKGYLLIHHGPIYRLSDDYRSIEAKIAHVEGMGESPAMFKKEGLYYLLTSNLTSWERNDNYYFTASRLEGPWKKQGFFCPEGTLTWNSQSTYVFPLKQGNDTIPMYMGDRWSYPHQASAATYVWLPMMTEGEKLSIPEYWNAWNTVKVAKALPLQGREQVHNWSSGRKGDCLEREFNGGCIAVIGKTNGNGGYATFSILDSENNVLDRSFIDFYSKVPDEGIRFFSKNYPKGTYRLRIEVTGTQSVWYNKKKTIRYGSHGYWVNITKTIEIDSEL